MREVTVYLRFTKECLGSVKRMHNDPLTGSKWPVFLLPRLHDGRIRFEANWWKSSMRFAAEVLCRHHKAVEKIHFDIAIEGQPDIKLGWYRRFLDSKRYVKHEAFRIGDEIGVTCIVPNDISDDDFIKLMEFIGRFKGISPFGPREYGFFEVARLQRKIKTINEEDTAEPGLQCDS